MSTTPFANIPTTEYPNRFVVRFRVRGGHIRYGQNRSATFDYSPFVLTIPKAKIFANMDHARAWVRRVVPGLLNSDFLEGLTIVNLEDAINQERAGTAHL